MSTCPSCGHIWRASLVDEVAAVVRDSGAPVRRKEIERAFPKVSVGQCLQRAIDRGLIRKVERGVYQAVVTND